MTYTLTVTVLGQDGQPRSGVSVIAELNKTDFTSDGVYLPSFQKVSSDENGIAQLELISNLVGTQNSRYNINIKHGRGKEENFTIQMPEANTTLAQLVEQQPVNTDTQTAAAISAALAEKWATGTEPGGAGTQSSREWAESAEATVQGAIADIEEARDSALTNISTAQTDAVAAVNGARDQGVLDVQAARDQGVGAVETARDNAIATINDLITQAEDARDAAKGFRNESEGFKNTAQTEAGNAAGSATSASQSATSAGEDAALSEKWATGTEPGGVGTKSAREEAERAEAAADVLPDPVGQGSGLVPRTKGDGTYILSPQSSRPLEFSEDAVFQYRFREANTLVEIELTGVTSVDVDWGDGTVDTVTSSGVVSHTYTAGGTYTVTLAGEFGGYDFTGRAGSEHLFRVKSFGINTDVLGFRDSGIKSVPGVLPAGITNMLRMFSDTPFNQDISSWDVSNVTNMQRMFEDTPFNQDIGSWDVSNVTDMSNMFRDTNFNQDIGSWDVSNVTDMETMFFSSPFNQDIGSWDVSNVTNMRNLFALTNFNQDISAWDVSNVTDMETMFFSSSFNQDISAWDVSSVTTTRNLFAVTPFNQDIGSWDVSNVTDISRMFRDTPFNQDISSWDVSSVTDMARMLEDSPFNQDISAWDVSNVTNMDRFLFDGQLSTANYDALLLAWSQLTLQLDVTAHFGSSTYSTDGTGDPLTDPAAARQKIIDDFGWTITDGGPA